MRCDDIDSLHASLLTIATTDINCVLSLKYWTWIFLRATVLWISHLRSLTARIRQAGDELIEPPPSAETRRPLDLFSHSFHPQHFTTIAIRVTAIIVAFA